MTPFRIAVLLAAAVALAPAASAQDPAPSRSAVEVSSRMTYSGFLSDADGTPLADGTRTLTFRGYAADPGDGAVPIWEEAHEANVADGRFLVVLGSKAPLTPDAEWLTVAVDGEPASAPVRFGGNPSASLAPGNTLQDSYDNGRVINTVPGSPISIKGVSGSADVGLLVRDITTVFTNDDLARLRLRSITGGRTWEFRVYGANNQDPGPGAFAFSDATGSGADALTLLPGVGEDLLILDNQTVNVGSVDTQSDLALYTTPNPSDPEAGKQNVAIADYGGYGGALTMYDEEGKRYGEIQPLISGTGGYLRLFSQTGTTGFEVGRGATANGTRLFLGGPAATTFDTGLTGTAAVQLAWNGVSDFEIEDEAGAANAWDSGSMGLNDEYNLTLSRTITAPTNGYVIAFATGELQISHQNGTSSRAQMSVSDDCDATPTAPNSQQANLYMTNGAASGLYQYPVSVHGLFTVSAGSHTFCNVVYQFPGSTIVVDDQNLTLLFVPTSYGSIQTNLADGALVSSDDTVGSLPAAADLQAERDASIRDNEARMAAELEALTRRMAEVEALVGRNDARE